MKKYRKQSQPIVKELVFEPVSKQGSLTTPDQSISVREILHRYTKGESLNIAGGQPVYLEHVPLYDTRRKHNIDIAEDKLENEKIITSQNQKVIDNIIEEKKFSKSLQPKEVKPVIELPPSQT